MYERWFRSRRIDCPFVVSHTRTTNKKRSEIESNKVETKTEMKEEGGFLRKGSQRFLIEGLAEE